MVSLWVDSAEVLRRGLPDPPLAMTVVRNAVLADPRYRIEVAATAVVATSERSNRE